MLLFFFMVTTFEFRLLQIHVKRIGTLLLLILMLESCRELIDEPYPDYNPVPVVNALLKEGDTLKVNISLAEKLDTNSLGFVDDAVVDLFVDDMYVETLTYTENGEYNSKTVVKTLKKYSCKVLMPGFDTITCEQLIPSIPRIINITHINIAGKDEEVTSFPAIELTFENNLKIDSYYEVQIYKLWDNNSFREAYLKTISDPILLNEGLPMALFSNEIITDSVYTMHINYTTGLSVSSNGGPQRTILFPIKVELRQVTEDYYRFKKQYYLYSNGLEADGVLTSMTNNNLYSNIDNAYGIFAAYSSTSTDTITPNPDDYDIY